MYPGGKHERPFFTTIYIEKIVENKTCSGFMFLTNLEVFWKCGETLSFVFDRSSQSELKLRRKHISKHRHGLYFLCLDFIIINEFENILVKL